MKRILTTGLLLLLVAGCGNSGGALLEQAETEEVVAQTPEPPAEENEHAAGEEESNSDSDSDRDNDVPAEEGTEKETDFGDPVTSNRGFLIKEIGQSAGFVDEEERDTVHFVLTAIELNPECTAEHVDKPENGNYLALYFEVETFAALADSGEVFTISSHDFRVWDEDDMRINEPSAWGTCIPMREMLPNDFGPADKANGWILLDIPNTAGTVAFLPYGEGGGGWEWSF